MFIYRQSTGQLLRDGEIVATGYAGYGEGKNNPAMQHVPMVGPIPQGEYVIGTPHDHKKLGSFVMYLQPDEDNEMFGRSAFYIHGDSRQFPGSSSHGCIVLDRLTRLDIAHSGVKRLQVTA